MDERTKATHTSLQFFEENKLQHYWFRIRFNFSTLKTKKFAIQIGVLTITGRVNWVGDWTEEEYILKQLFGSRLK